MPEVRQPRCTGLQSAGQLSDYTGAAALLDDWPQAQGLLGDGGYDADWCRDALHAKGLKPCIPGRRSPQRSGQIQQAPQSTPQPHRRMFGRHKNWRRVLTRYDRCPTTFFSAVALAAPHSCSGSGQFVLTPRKFAEVASRRPQRHAGRDRTARPRTASTRPRRPRSPGSRELGHSARTGRLLRCCWRPETTPEATNVKSATPTNHTFEQRFTASAYCRRSDSAL